MEGLAQFAQTPTATLKKVVTRFETRRLHCAAICIGGLYNPEKMYSISFVISNYCECYLCFWTNVICNRCYSLKRKNLWNRTTFICCFTIEMFDDWEDCRQRSWTEMSVINVATFFMVFVVLYKKIKLVFFLEVSFHLQKFLLLSVMPLLDKLQ